MKNCAILSMDNLQAFECYDCLLDKPLLDKGWKTHTVSWRDETVDWEQFDAVIIRSPWDYQDDADKFVEVLEKIDASSAHLENPLELIKWNIDKTYLKELENQGIEIVPTVWRETFLPGELISYFTQFDTEEIIIKPTISANADNTFRIPLHTANTLIEELKKVFKEKPFMVQPFMTSIVDEGEFSLFYFAGQYSHTILKKPKKNDFRVQEEHGGILTKIEPEPALLEQADKVNRRLQPAPLYSRLDFVRTEVGFAVMEVELIEPSLYFNMDEGSAERFAEAFAHWML
ncbi:MAG TPA: hypothetical protein ENJ60_12840 [Aeromonadales bacterium]|nr:hypothetical protein [Aeromonadales bacterium]